MTDRAPIDISVVTTLYGSERFVADFVAQASRAAAAVSPRYEIILVNDGSPDHSLSAAVALQAADSHIVVVDLSRNFGHHQALRAGLSFARGAQVFLIDSDLEEKPEWLLSFHRLRVETGADAVYGVQRARKGKWFERASGACFYWLFNRLSDIPIPVNSVTARLLTRRYVDAILAFEERALFLPGLWELAGFQQSPHPVDKDFRGATTYSPWRRIALGVNALTSFSDRPLIFIFYIGMAISAVSMFLILSLIYLKLVHGIPLMGWPSLIVSVWFLGGMIIVFTGVIGIYLAKVFVEMKGRPSTIVRALYRAGGD